MITDKLWYQMWEFDRKNPHDRYKLYCKGYEEKDLNKLLQFLYYINSFFGEKLDLNGVYLVEDAKFIELMEYLGIKFVSEKLFVLYKIGYIYYFTCAKKFAWKDETVKQFRINSWGREYCEKFSDQLANSKIEEVLNDNFEQYAKVVDLINNKEAAKLQKMNQYLPLTIVY